MSLLMGNGNRFCFPLHVLHKCVKCTLESHITHIFNNLREQFNQPLRFFYCIVSSRLSNYRSEYLYLNVQRRLFLSFRNSQLGLMTHIYASNTCGILSRFSKNVGQVYCVIHFHWELVEIYGISLILNFQHNRHKSSCFKQCSTASILKPLTSDQASFLIFDISYLFFYITLIDSYRPVMLYTTPS